jgi:putative DNA primase/helicase
MILSTGELGIADKIREGGKRVRAGQEIRILDLDADAGKGSGIFDSDGAKIADEIRAAAAEASYGTAGPAFIKAIEDNGLQKVTDDLDVTHKALIARLTEGIQDAQAKRAAQRFSERDTRRQACRA